MKEKYNWKGGRITNDITKWGRTTCVCMNCFGRFSRVNGVLIRYKHIGKYCSNACGNIHRAKPRVKNSCKICEKIFFHSPLRYIATCSKECTRKARIGCLSPSWCGGTSRRGDPLACRVWRHTVRRRDKFICQFCKKVGGKQNSDHILPWALYPEFRFLIENGRTLCVECHKKTLTKTFRHRNALKGGPNYVTVDVKDIVRSNGTVSSLGRKFLYALRHNKYKVILYSKEINGSQTTVERLLSILRLENWVSRNRLLKVIVMIWPYPVPNVRSLSNFVTRNPKTNRIAHE